MKFVISTISHLESIGFDTTNWRKSEDGLYAIVHYEFIKILKPDLESDINIQIKEYQSADLENALVVGWGNEPSNIDQLRLKTIEKMSQTCEYKIINEFYSDCLGESKRFDCTLIDQSNILGLCAKAQLILSNPTMEDTSLEWKYSGQPVCYSWTPQQVLKLSLDLYNHKATNIKRFEELRLYINDLSRTEEEIDNVTWDMIL